MKRPRQTAQSVESRRQITLAARAVGRLGGLARKRACTKAQLSAIGKLGAAARAKRRTA